ncbi:response regulator [Myxococcota bacterium]|nr:response regulator [Myxococcota bacterium]
MAKILCVDDDRDVTDFCKIALEARGHEVFTAADGDEGLATAREIEPDVMLLDVMMKDVSDGFQTAYKIRQDERLRFTPILMLTSVNQVFNHKFSPDRDGSFLPVDDFVEKPIASKTLLEKVDKLLALTPDQINVG